MNPALTPLDGVAAIPLIAGAVQALKSAGLPPNLSPVASLLLGATGGTLFVLDSTNHDWIAGVILGLSWGLAASGLYSVAKKPLQGAGT